MEAMCALKPEGHGRARRFYEREGLRPLGQSLPGRDTVPILEYARQFTDQ